jgi:hypothetical protein
MTTVMSKPKDYRLLVGLRYMNASDMLFQGLKAQQQQNEFHFLVTLRSFIEYTRRGIWFLVWASNEQLKKAEHLTFKEAGSPGLAKMDAMITKALGAGKVSRLMDIIPVVNEPFLDTLHALTHGNPIAVRMLGMNLSKVFDSKRLLAKAENDLNIFKLIMYRRVTKMPQQDIWDLLKPIYDKPVLLWDEVLKAAKDIKKQGGVKIPTIPVK